MSEATVTVITNEGLFDVRWPFAATRPPRTPVYWDAKSSVLTLDDRGGTLPLLGFIHEIHLPVADQPPDPAPRGVPVMPEPNPRTTAVAESLLAVGVPWQVIEAELYRIQTQADPASGQPIAFADEQVADQLWAALSPPDPAPDVTAEAPKP